MDSKVCETEGSAAKRCTKCNIEKTIDEYYTKGKKKNGDIRYYSHCKACHNQVTRQYKEEHKEEISAKNRQWRQDNCAKSRQYYQDNKEELCAKQRQRYQDNKEEECIKRRQYRKEHKEEISIKKNEYRKHRRVNDLEFKLKENIRRRINGAIHSQLNNGATKSAHSHELLGISTDKYIRWIEFQLKDGWTWDNWGSDFHIDHVYPIAKHDLSKKEEQFKAFNWKNTRPMCKKENMAKGAKIIQNEVFQHKVTVLAFLFHEIKFFN